MLAPVATSDGSGAAGTIRVRRADLTITITESLMLSRFALGALLVAAVGAPALVAQPTPVVVLGDEVKLPALLVGSDAPALSIEKWVKGSPVASFEKGKIYMVEFWATWCGPCIRSMPHITELQKKYGEKGLTVIGVTTVDPRNTLEKVEKMVADKGETIGYTVAWDSGTKTKEAFFAAAEQQGIPCSFLVDADGKVAYIGHPMGIDKVLEDVVNKKHDIKALADRYRQKLINQAKSEALQGQLGEAFQAEDWPKSLELCDSLLALGDEELLGIAHTKFMILAKKMNDEPKAYEWARTASKGIAKDNAQLLNAFAWAIVDPTDGFTNKDLDLALSIATDANTLEKGKDAGILDTLARVHFTKGDVQKAIEIQTSAVEFATDKKLKASLEETLAAYKAAAEKK